MKIDQLIYQNFGDGGLLITWPVKIDPSTNEQVLDLDEYIRSNFRKEILETVPAYQSLAVYLKDGVDVSELIKRIKNNPKTTRKKETNLKNVITIPVCYKSKFAPDIKEVAAFNKLTMTEVIRLHTQALYKVYFLGFLPGFPYLGGLDKKLHTPRKSTPRKFNEKGSVAIGGSQTGIYTSDSPGGWNIIGRSPLDFFSVSRQLFCLLKAGDYVKFKAISIKQYIKLEARVATGKYQIQKEVLND